MRSWPALPLLCLLFVSSSAIADPTPASEVTAHEIAGGIRCPAVRTQTFTIRMTSDSASMEPAEGTVHTGDCVVFTVAGAAATIATVEITGNNTQVNVCDQRNTSTCVVTCGLREGRYRLAATLSSGRRTSPVSLINPDGCWPPICEPPPLQMPLDKMFTIMDGWNKVTPK